jgi:hypothetical protein
MMPSCTTTIDGSSHEGLMKKKKNEVDVLNLHMNIPHSLEGDEGLKGPPNLVRLLPGDIIGGIIAPSHRARRTQPRSSISQDTCMVLQHQQLLLPTSDLLFPPSSSHFVALRSLCAIAQYELTNRINSLSGRQHRQVNSVPWPRQSRIDLH